MHKLPQRVRLFFSQLGVLALQFHSIIMCYDVEDKPEEWYYSVGAPSSSEVGKKILDAGKATGNVLGGVAGAAGGVASGVLSGVKDPLKNTMGTAAELAGSAASSAGKAAAGIAKGAAKAVGGSIYGFVSGVKESRKEYACNNAVEAFVNKPTQANATAMDKACVSVTSNDHCATLERNARAVEKKEPVKGTFYGTHGNPKELLHGSTTYNTCGLGGEEVEKVGVRMHPISAAAEWFHGPMPPAGESNLVAMRLFMDLIGWANHRKGTMTRLCVQPDVLAHCLALGDEKCKTEGDGICYLHHGTCVDNKSDCPKVAIGEEMDEYGEPIKSIMPITLPPWSVTLDEIVEPIHFREDGFAYHTDDNRIANTKFYTKRGASGAIDYVVITFNWNDQRSALDLNQRHTNPADYSLPVGAPEDYVDENGLILQQPLRCYRAVATQPMENADGVMEPEDAIVPRIRYLLELFSEARIVLCGHSLGAGLVNAALIQLAISDATSEDLARVHAVTTGGPYVLTKNGVDLIKSRFVNEAQNIIDFCYTFTVTGIANTMTDGYTRSNYWIQDAVGVPLARLNSFLLKDSGIVPHDEGNVFPVYDPEFHDLYKYIETMARYMKSIGASPVPYAP